MFRKIRLFSSNGSKWVVYTTHSEVTIHSEVTTKENLIQNADGKFVLRQCARVDKSPESSTSTQRMI